MAAGAGVRVVCVCRGEWPPSHVSDESNGKRRIWVETVSFGVSHLACNPYPARKHTHPPRGVSQPFPGDTARAVSPPDARRCGRQGAPPQGTGEAPSRPRWPQRHSPGPGTPQRPQLPPRAGERRAASASPCPGTPCAGCRGGAQACRGSHVPSPAVSSRGTQEEPVTHFLPAFAGGCSCVGSCCAEANALGQSHPGGCLGCPAGLGERGLPRPGPALPPQAQARPGRHPRRWLSDVAVPSLSISIAEIEAIGARRSSF